MGIVELPIVQKLTAFGLMEKEAQLYLSLVRDGPLKASSLASALGISRMEVYRLAKSMVEKGLISVEVSKPQRFVANPPEVIFDNLLEGLKRKLSLLEGEKEGVLKELSKYVSAPQREYEYRFRMVEGRHNSYSIIKKATERASTKLDLIMTGDEVPFASLEGIDDALVASSKRGVKVRVLAEVSPRNLEIVKPIAEVLEIRHTKDTQDRMMIADGKECFVSLVMKGERPEEEVGIWTNGLHFVKLMEKNFESSFSAAELGSQTIRSIEARMGSVTVYNSVLALVRERVREAGLEFESPAVIMGRAGERHEFTLQIANPKSSDKLLLADFYVSASKGLETEFIMPSVFKLLDVSAPLRVVIAVPEIERKGAELCKFFGIVLISGEPEVATDEFIKLVMAKIL